MSRQSDAAKIPQQGKPPSGDLRMSSAEFDALMHRALRVPPPPAATPGSRKKPKGQPSKKR